MGNGAHVRGDGHKLFELENEGGGVVGRRGGGRGARCEKAQDGSGLGGWHRTSVLEPKEAAIGQSASEARTTAAESKSMFE